MKTAVALSLVLFPIILVQCFAVTLAQPDQQYVLVGVSGGLQDGFPDHTKMNYRHEDTVVRAIFIGKALVRGVKSFLDVMEEGWRQYTPRSSPQQPLINTNVVVTGCHEHANQYWIYAVDVRQFLVILNNEPRFLSITPDTAMVDLTIPQTDVEVKRLAWHEIARQNMTDMQRVAFPIVVATWYHPRLHPSPIVQTLEDGTQVTNFPGSLALWANVSDYDRTVSEEYNDNMTCSVSDKENRGCFTEQLVSMAKRRYWDGIGKAIRDAEDHPLSTETWRGHGPPFSCHQMTRMGVGPQTARINYPFTRVELEKIFDVSSGFTIDFDKATIHILLE